MADAAMNSRSAALPMLPASHTATNSCKLVRSMRRAKLRSVSFTAGDVGVLFKEVFALFSHETTHQTSWMAMA